MSTGTFDIDDEDFRMLNVLYDSLIKGENLAVDKANAKRVPSLETFEIFCGECILKSVRGLLDDMKAFEDKYSSEYLSTLPVEELLSLMTDFIDERRDNDKEEHCASVSVKMVLPTKGIITESMAEEIRRAIMEDNSMPEEIKSDVIEDIMKEITKQNIERMANLENTN